jgi:hypothetical protein
VDHAAVRAHPYRIWPVLGFRGPAWCRGWGSSVCRRRRIGLPASVPNAEDFHGFVCNRNRNRRDVQISRRPRRSNPCNTIFYIGSIFTLWLICCLFTQPYLRFMLGALVGATEFMLLPLVANTPRIAVDLEWPMWAKYISSGLPLLIPTSPAGCCATLIWMKVRRPPPTLRFAFPCSRRPTIPSRAICGSCSRHCVINDMPTGNGSCR